uniref:Uncharacterized protein n=1 Tax=Molossus molossus TaxID=27622 RepID=A0A7J8F9A1_MOLMO|nr:hypothetical protein HJG59_008573 [Molossus molossus]
MSLCVSLKRIPNECCVDTTRPQSRDGRREVAVGPSCLVLCWGQSPYVSVCASSWWSLLSFCLVLCSTFASPSTAAFSEECSIHCSWPRGPSGNLTPPTPLRQLSPLNASAACSMVLQCPARAGKQRSWGAEGAEVASSLGLEPSPASNSRRS